MRKFQIRFLQVWNLTLKPRNRAVTNFHIPCVKIWTSNDYCLNFHENFKVSRILTFIIDFDDENQLNPSSPNCPELSASPRIDHAENAKVRVDRSRPNFAPSIAQCSNDVEWNMSRIGYLSIEYWAKLILVGHWALFAVFCLGGVRHPTAARRYDSHEPNLPIGNLLSLTGISMMF